MIRSATRPRGHMTLTLLDRDDRPLRRHEHPNEVLDSGRAALLELLSGTVTSEGLSLVLALGDFRPDVDAITQGVGVLPLRNARNPRFSVGKDGLEAIFRGDASRDAQIIGAALMLSLRPPEDMRGRDVRRPVLYNFAKLAEPVEVEAEQPLSVRFTLTME
ncbi:hypothetical protein [Rhodobaculum claviforme]|uniref:Uncharacterized protein n=1 Tax=Rhodobaculum claviforme TaxID=1549854 RepID=A0A934THP3_9RHOB|nr:hypothetical protein [Rhodobaculum claviforme]MBK5925791.1 hypothetical protein [Rhodobaculum claviforme]